MSVGGLFLREYEAELESWLQRRFGYLCVAFAIIEVIHVAVTLVGLTLDYDRVDAVTGPYWVGLGAALLGLAVISSFQLRKLRRLETRPALLQATTWLILTLGAIAVAESVVDRLWFDADAVQLLGRFFVWHLTACLILPWTPRESLRPMIPLLAAWAVDRLVAQGAESLGPNAIAVVASPLLLVPGVAICAMRLHLHGRRFHSEMVGKQFVRLRRELLQARGLHESMFPKPADDGYVRFEYSYAPARDVGGDFIHLHVGETGLVCVTVIDVTGHGVAAALTVNRLSGELERVRAEHPRIEPEEVVSLLNRYVHLTLAKHGVYATAVVFEIDPYAGEVRFANAGHPPLIIRRRNGLVEPLDSTGMMLGAVGDSEFECQAQRVKLDPGDMVVAFTDGAFEAMNRRGEQLGIGRIADALRRTNVPGNWPQFLTAMVERHHGGRSQDDVLIATVVLERYRSSSARTPSTSILTKAGVGAASTSGVATRS